MTLYPHPFHCSQGVSACRDQPPCTLLLREGTFYLEDTLQLDPSDSGLTVQPYNNEEVWISGGIPVTPMWKPFRVTNDSWVVVEVRVAGALRRALCLHW